MKKTCITITQSLKRCFYMSNFVSVPPLFINVHVLLSFNKHGKSSHAFHSWDGGSSTLNTGLAMFLYFHLLGLWKLNSLNLKLYNSPGKKYWKDGWMNGCVNTWNLRNACFFFPFYFWIDIGQHISSVLLSESCKVLQNQAWACTSIFS